MPKLKPSDKEERGRILRAMICGNRERYGISNEYIASRLGICGVTLENRMKDPDTFKFGELQELARILKFSPVQAASIILGRNLTAKEVKDFILM